MSRFGRSLAYLALAVGSHACTFVGGFDEDRVGAPGLVSSSSGTTSGDATSSGVGAGGGDGGAAPASTTSSAGAGGTGGGGGAGGDEPIRRWPDSRTPFCIDGLGIASCEELPSPLQGQDGAVLTDGATFEIDLGSGGAGGAPGAAGPAGAGGAGEQLAIEEVTGFAWDRVAPEDLENWINTKDACADIDRDGDLVPDGYRMPTLRELVSIVDAGRIAGLDTSALPEVNEENWVDDPPFESDRHLVLRFGERPGIEALPSSGGRAWHTCIKAGAKLVADFDGDGEHVLDRSTGLRWEVATEVADTWTDALVACQHDEFHLASFKELATLLDMAEPDHIDGTAFEGPAPGAFWTSTPVREPELDDDERPLAIIALDFVTGTTTAVRADEPAVGPLHARCVANVP